MSRSSLPGRFRVSLTVCLLAALLASCKALPPELEVPLETALPPAGSGPLFDTAAEALRITGGPDAAILVPDAQSALDWRLAMIDSARVSLDMQYFVWSGDQSGTLLLDRLLRAADRGVRIRLLFDDLYLLADSNFSGPDEVLAAIDAHPNVDFKLFNPGRFRSGKVGIGGNFATGFREFNRRMHNKLIVADGVIAMTGGRNLADEYYGVRSDVNFVDLDAVVVGSVLPQVARAFDVYWNSEPTYAADTLNPDATGAELESLRSELATYLAEHAETLASFPAQPHDWSEFLAAGAAGMLPGRGTFMQDDPEEADDNEIRLYDMLKRFDTPEDKHIYLVSPYLIPLQEGIDEIEAMVDSGLRVTLLTASLSSGDLEASNAHYKKYRKRILEAGAELYEFHHQPGPAMRTQADVPPVRADHVAFHPKVAVTDARVCFVGSLNLDPRAVVINTENGLVFESESFCGRVQALIEDYIQPENSWRVTLDADGELQWTSYEGTVHQQPARSGSQRVADFIFRLLPIEDIL